MKSIAKLLLVVPVAALAACSVSSYCEDQQDYELAGSVPPLKGDDALRVPQSEATLRIPPPPPQAVAFGEVYKDAEGEDAVRCLDKPPELASLPPEKPAEPAPLPPASGAAPAAGSEAAPAPATAPPPAAPSAESPPG